MRTGWKARVTIEPEFAAPLSFCYTNRMPTSEDRPDRRNVRNGMLLFLLYLLFYGGFVYLNAFRSDLMAKPSLGGINLATVYGLALIVVALILALVYMMLCRGNLASANSEDAK
jgi:uncharacterized membrane protein (DUF485 family)